jgi:predicted nucleic acid-binding protein
MSGKSTHEYWDTCIFLAHLQNEEHRNGEAEEIASQIKRFEMGALNLYTSSITITELIEAARLTEEQVKQLRGFFRRSNFQFIDANESICSLASEIRSYFKQNPIAGLYPSTPDAIQVASAVALRRQLNEDLKLITLDSNNKPNKKELAMIEMAPYVAAKYGVIITRPEVPALLRG